VRRDTDCYSLAKISEILAGANILHGGPVQCRRESAHKSRAASGNGTLGDYMWRDRHLLEDVGEH
jgi:hypothetical protein